MAKLRLALYGNFGRYNIGNECTLRAVLLHVREQLPDAALYCVCSDPSVVTQEHGVDAVAIAGVGSTAPRTHRASKWGALRKLRRLMHAMVVAVPREVRELLRALRILKGTDALLLVGTGMLEDEDGSIDWPLATYRWTLAAAVRGCRVVVLGIGAGPFQVWATRILSTAILRTADYASYRDQESKDYLSAAGLNTQRHFVVPDLAFSLPATIPSAPARTALRPTVAVGVIDRSKFYSEAQYLDYLKLLCEFVRRIVDMGATVKVIHGDGLYDRESLRALQRLLQEQGEFDDNDILSIPQIKSLDDLLAVLKDVDLVVASRYHNMILALMLGKPVLALSYHWKFASVMSAFPLSDCVRPVQEFELSWLMERYAELVARRVELEPMIRRAANRCRDDVMSQYRTVSNLLQSCPSR